MGNVDFVSCRAILVRGRVRSLDMPVSTASAAAQDNGAVRHVLALAAASRTGTPLIAST